MTMLEELLREVGDELDRLSHEWDGERSEPQRQSRPTMKPRWVAAAAAAALLVTTGVVLPKLIGGDEPPRGVGPAVATEPPPVAPEDLPWELLAAPPAGYELAYASDGGHGNDFEPPVVLLGWQAEATDESMVYVAVERTSPVIDAPAGARQVDEDGLSGWVGQLGNRVDAQFETAGGPVRIHAFSPGVPVEDVIALAVAVTGAAPEVEFAAGTTPAPFVELAGQAGDVHLNTVSYHRESALGDSLGDSLTLDVLTEIPLSYYPSDSPITVARTTVAGRAGLVVEHPLCCAGGGSARQLLWRGADGAWRILTSSSGGDPLPLPALLALANSIRPATDAEIEAVLDPTSERGVAGEPAPPYPLLDPVPEGFELIETTVQDGRGFPPPAMLLGWDTGGDDLIPIVVARDDEIWRAEAAAGSKDAREVGSAAARGTVADSGGVTAAAIEVDGATVYLVTPSTAIPDEDLVAIGAAVEPSQPDGLSWTAGAPPPGVVELLRQEADFAVHEASYRQGNRSLWLQTYSAMPVSWMVTAPGARARVVSVAGNSGVELVQPGTGATSRWLYWTGADGVVYSLTEDSPTGRDLDLEAIAETIVLVNEDEFTAAG